MKDHYGNPISTGSSTARDHYDAGVKLLLGSGFGAIPEMEAALAADPGFALGHVGLARAHMAAADMPAARAALARAETLVASGTDREKQHVAANMLMARGKSAAARSMVERHIRDYPCDALVAQMCTSVFGLIAFSGCAATEPQILAYTSGLLPHYGDDDWWIKSVHAVSLCETGQPERALDLMETSLALNPENANGAHFKSHALYEMGQTEQGRRYLEKWIAGYDRRGVLHGHLAWHVALWALAQGDHAAMWTRFDTEIGPGASQGLPINILTDCASLLHRAALAGVDVPAERWAAISAYAATAFPNPGQSFVDLHAGLAHAMAGDGERLARYLEAEKGYATDLIRPITACWAAMVHQDWDAAITALAPAMAETARLGGSRAQRDLLEFTYLHLLLRTGNSAEAKRLLQTRRPALGPAQPVAGLVA